MPKSKMTFRWKEFGRTLRRAREAEGIGLRELARQLKISSATLSHIERGQPASGPMLVFLARWQNSTCDLHQFLSRDPYRGVPWLPKK